MNIITLVAIEEGAKMGDSTDANEDFVFFIDSNGVRAIFKKLTND